MELPWIKITPELQNGIEIINDLDIGKFQKFLIHIKENSSVRSKSEIFASEEIVALERVFKLDSEAVSIVIKTTVYILERLSKFVMRPKCILNDLTNILMIEKEKAEAFFNVWQSLLKSTADDYNIDNFGIKDQLVNTKCDINLAICSHLNKKEKLTSVLLQMQTTNDKLENNIPVLEFTTDELLNFNNQLDNIQLELDTILSGAN